MDRRDTLKALAVGTVSTHLLIQACKPADKEKNAAPNADTKSPEFTLDRMEEEKLYEKKLQDQGQFFTNEELATITALADIIIPKDEVSGSASEAGVPAFIDFIVRDMPEHQIPMRGGLRWLDVQCLNKYNKPFTSCDAAKQTEIIDQIAYPSKGKASMMQGVAFFSLLRNLTATGFYTSEMGVQDIGYLGNKPNQWNGVPDEVLKQYGLSYSDKELRECINFDKT